MQTEIWKDLDGFDYYRVSSLGRIKRKSTHFIRTDGRRRFFNEKLLGGNYNKGYLFIALQKVGESKKYPVHRIVAKTFIPNPENLPQVNHKNGIRKDNRVENLEWCTALQNERHSIEVLGKDCGKHNRKKVLCITTGKEYDSGRAVAREYHVPFSNIYNVLLGHSKQTMGLKFVYVNER